MSLGTNSKPFAGSTKKRSTRTDTTVFETWAENGLLLDLTAGPRRWHDQSSFVFVFCILYFSFDCIFICNHICIWLYLYQPSLQVKEGDMAGASRLCVESRRVSLMTRLHLTVNTLPRSSSSTPSSSSSTSSTLTSSSSPSSSLTGVHHQSHHSANFSTDKYCKLYSVKVC